MRRPVVFNRSSIAKEAHRIARIYAPTRGYRAALSWGFKDAWSQAKGMAAIAARDAAMSPVARANRDEAIAIQCSTDGRLSDAARFRLSELSRAA
jgi:hypothetical protein